MKYVKLLIIALVLVGGIVGLLYFINTKEQNQGVRDDFASAQANEWKSQIDMMCEKGKWSTKEYNNIETGIHTDRVSSEGDLISTDEENALRNYLYSKSCDYLQKQVDNLFKQKSYSEQVINNSKNMLAFLNGKRSEFGSNSNLDEASQMLSEYSQLIGSLSFSSGAMYSRPLRAYSGVSAASVRSRINGLKHYNSHFKNNPTIKAKVDGLESNRERAESEYYSNLEKAIENHYHSTQDRIALMEDQIRFGDISTNSAAIRRLESFVNNPNR